MPREAKFKMGDNVTARYGKNVIRSAEIMAYNRNSNYYWLKIDEEFSVARGCFVWLPECTLILNKD